MSGPSRLELLLNQEYKTYSISHADLSRHADVLDNVTYTVERFPDRRSTIFLNDPRDIIRAGIANQILGV